MTTPSRCPPAHAAPLLAAAGLLLLTFAAYLPAAGAGFIWDDDTFLTENPVMRRADGLYRIWCTTELPDYFPLTSSMLWAEWQLWGPNPAGFHVVNILLHALSAVLLWRVLLRLRVPGAWVAAMVFALHPVNVESVAWITERKNTLPMVFYLLAALAYLRFEDGDGRRFYALALGAFLLALLAKTSVVMLPLVLLGIAWWRRGKLAGRDLVRVAPFLLLSLALGLVTVWYQSHRSIGIEIIRADSFAGRLATAGWAVWFYLYKALLPVNLSFAYPRWSVDPAVAWSWLPLAALLGAGVFLLVHRRPWTRAALLGMGYFVVSLLPVLGFIDIYFMKISLVADHWQYFAIPGVIALAVAGAAWLLRISGDSPKAAPLAATGLGLLLAVGAWRQCLHYQDLDTLWEATLRANPDCTLVLNNLGVRDYQSGNLAAARAKFEHILRVNKDYREAHTNMGHILSRSGDTAGAQAHYRRALELYGDDDAALNGLGVLLATADPRQAQVHLERAVQLNPDVWQYRGNLADLFIRTHQAAKALPHLERILQLKSDLVPALTTLARLLATDPALANQNPLRAIELAKRACVLTSNAAPAPLDTLAAAYANAGQFDLAVATARAALALAESPATRQHLELFQAGKPLRE